MYYDLYQQEKKNYEEELEAYSGAKETNPDGSMSSAIDDTTAGIAAINTNLSVKVEPQ